MECSNFLSLLKRILTFFFLFCGFAGFMPAQQWNQVQIFEGAPKAAATALAAGPGGVLAMGGVFEQQLSLDGIALEAIGEDDIFLALLNAEGAVEWATAGGSNLDDELAAVAIDGDGNVLCAGAYWFEGTFGGDTLTTSLNPKGIFLLKYSPLGQLVWARSIEGTNLKGITDLAVDGSGNVYVCGFFSGELHVESSVLTAAGNTDLFVAKYNPEGTRLWATRAGHLGNTRAMKIAVADDQTVFLSGFYDNQTIIGPDVLQANTFDRDVFLARFDLVGQPVWARKAGGVFDEEVTGLALDGQGNIFLTGYLVGVMNLDGGISIQSQNGNPDFYLIQYNEDGVPLMARAMGGPMLEQTTGLALADGLIAVSGFHLGSMTIDGISASAGAGISGFIAGFDMEGKARWIKSIPAEQALYPQALAINSQNRLYVAGSFQGAAFFDGVPYSAGGSFDIFLARTDGALTSVEETNPHHEVPLLIYPNPAREQLNILTELSEYKVSVFDTQGKLALQANNCTTIDTELLPAGMYFVLVEARGFRFREKIVVVK